ncbi:MAG: hypothetical protein FJW39_32775 [Acidobacteria bacterium]|nr:hypothetical protein [Acidobacteriota bacterium]
MNWVIASLLAAGLPLCAENLWFAGAGAGLSTLSGDAASSVSAATTAVSQYKPENGPLFHVFAGRHWREYLSFQAVYSWNRNEVALLSAVTTGGAETTYEQARRSRQHNVAGDAMLYFRKRKSWVRPYLSIGLGVMHFRSHSPVLRISKGRPSPPGPVFTAVKPGLRAAAGIELMHPSGWGFRYAFLETIQGNPVSAQLSPKGSRGLANFQNTFGFVRYF